MSGDLPELVAGVDEHLARLRTDLDSVSGSQRWARLQQEFSLDPDLLHFNTGSTGASPSIVGQAMARAQAQIDADPAANTFAGGVADGMEHTRARAARLLGADLDEVSLTRNSTEGMTQVALGLDLQAGDEVLTTHREHGGGVVGWEYLRQRIGIRINYVRLPLKVRDAQQVLDIVAAHLTPRTKAVSLMHVDTNTGTVYPLAQIAQITRPRGILLICDGAHAPGMLRVDVKALGVDTYASSSHKWLLAPKGNGLLYVRRDVRDRVQPVLLFSGPQAYSASSGTRDVVGVLGHGVAIDFHNAVGSDRVEARCRQLNAHLRARLLEHPHLRVVTPDQPELSSGILAVGVERMHAADVVRRLRDEYRVTVKATQATYALSSDPEMSGKSRADNCLRLSTHIYNDEQQVDRVADLLRHIVTG